MIFRDNYLMDTEQREALELSLEDLKAKIADSTPANVQRSAPWSWRLKRAGRALRGKH